jgi:PST family polysaccharide transporter
VHRGQNPGAGKALIWSFANIALSKAGTLGIGIVLARLLGPEAFGTYAVAYVALVAVLSFNELGVSLAIVRWPGDPAKIAPTVTTLSLATSAAIAAGGYLAAPWFAASMGAPDATDVVRLLLVSVLIDGAVATPAALLQRMFRQDKRMLIDQVNVWVGALLSVLLAVLGSGAMSLAVGRVAGSLAAGVLFVIFSPLPYRLGLDRTQLRPLLAFGLPLAGASLVVFAAGNADQLVAGRLLGPTMLGFYVLAFNVSSWPVSVFSGPMRTVAPAAFAHLHGEPERRPPAFGALVTVLAAAALPVCGFIAGGADAIVAFVYGSAWAPAAGVLRVLAILAALRILFELAYDYLVVLGRTGAVFGVQAVWLVLLVPALIVGALTGSIEGVAIAELLVAALGVTPVYLWLLRRNGIPAGALIGRLAWPAVAGVAVGCLSYAASGMSGGGLVACLIGGVAACLAMAGLLARQRGAITEIRRIGGARKVVTV